ncbi:cytochrome P450 family protein [Streptomyces corynorhini]|uniref:Cytochrome P450 n=1 Tax=Streptomyces corynorhini TaxID=2282652 RepID=A0A370B0Z9_9ACTN|nr:cytochrome P450 [Streptomyces corynorhini]RDG33025.1 cytochrome P450 [Streptomyces corynorhini]
MAVIELAHYGPDFNADPYPYYAKLRETGPVHEVIARDGDPFWLVVGYEEGREALADPRLSKALATMGYESSDEAIMGPHVLTLDPPDHTRLRKLVAPEFTARRVERMLPRIQRVTDELLDAMGPSGSGDLVDALAFPLPITVICELLGVPLADRDTFRVWTNEIVAPTTPEGQRVMTVELCAYLDALIEDKRKAGPTDDLLSSLLRARAEDGDRLSAAELRAWAYVLLIAGHETTVNLIANAVRCLLAHPGQLAALRADFGLLDGAIEETLRFEGPVETSTVRFTREPVSYAGTEIPAHRTVLISLASADRDPARFPDPDTFDIRRSATEGRGPGHLAFGHGIHFCVGAPLARLEARIVLRTLLERCPDLALDPAAGAYDWLPGLLIRGVRALPVRW